MSAKSVRLLHVEDDPIQHKLVAYSLRGVANHEFQITKAGSEDEAIKTFAREGADLVILDYYLAEGNGLQVLRHIRQLDPLVPVIALSGQALPETAMELVQAGADDFISKRDLTAKGLATSVEAALRRSEQVKQRVSPEVLERTHLLEDCFAAMCAELLGGTCQALVAQLDAFEAEARKCQLSSDQLRRLFETAADAADLARKGRGAPGGRLLRPMLLELRERLFPARTSRSGLGFAGVSHQGGGLRG